VFNLETNTIIESCDVTFDKTALYLVMSLNVQVTRKWRVSEADDNHFIINFLPICLADMARS
jgi:hypothetical protein